MSDQSFFTTIRQTLASFRRHNASRFGAALAFYVVFSIAPTLLIAIAVAGAVFGRELAEREILASVSGSFGHAAGAAIAAMIKDASSVQTGWLATLLGLATLYFGLTGVYRQIDDALRTIWDARKVRDPEAVPKLRHAPMFLTLFTGVVVLFSVMADAAIAFTGNRAAERLLGGEVLWHTTQLIASTLVLAFLFATVFRSMVRPRLSWRDVRLGAAITAILFVLGKFALGLYLGKAAVGSAFGAAGSIVVVLLWSYWSAQIFFFGLELTHVIARKRA